MLEGTEAIPLKLRLGHSGIKKINLHFFVWEEMIVLVESWLDVNVLDSHLFAKILLPQLGAI